MHQKRENLLLLPSRFCQKGQKRGRRAICQRERRGGERGRGGEKERERGGGNLSPTQTGLTPKGESPGAGWV